LPAKPSPLLQVLSAEAGCIEHFIALLETEQAALKTGEVDQLPGLADAKSALATKLAKLAAERGQALSNEGCSSDRAGIAAWSARHPQEKDAPRLWTEIAALAAKARELNRVNGELIALRMQYNAKALEALRGGDKALDLYGPDGQATGAVSRRINDAV